MGRNTTILICNDAFDAVDADPAGWWQETRKVIAGVHHVRQTHGTGVEYGFGNYANGFRVICEDHADYTNLVAVGGNHATSLLRVHNGGNHHGPEDQVDLLRQAAWALGFKLESRLVESNEINRMRRAYEKACARLVAIGEHPPTVDD